MGLIRYNDDNSNRQALANGAQLLPPPADCDGCIG
jgi:hypothetical protein